MKGLKYFAGALLLALTSVLQSCDDDDNDFYTLGWDWSTVRIADDGSHYLVGDTWGTIIPVSTSVDWSNLTDGNRVVAFFEPVVEIEGGGDALQVDMKGIQEILTKKVEDAPVTEEEIEEYGNDPILIYQGDMWLGGQFLNIIFRQNLPRSTAHRISLVRKEVTSEEETEEEYLYFDLLYNTYDDETGSWTWGRVSYNMEEFYKQAEESTTEIKGFKIVINSKENGQGCVVVLDFNHPVGVPEAAANAEDTQATIR